MSDLRSNLRSHLLASLYLILGAGGVGSALAQGTAFTYQGRLQTDGEATAGLFDLRLAVYAAESGGASVGPVLTNNAVTITNGLFTVSPDFGAGIFNGFDRWLEIAVRTNGSGAFTVLAPRQRLGPTPYAIRAAEAGTATLLAANSVTSAALQANAVDSSKIADSSIALNDLAGPVVSNTFWRLSGNTGTTPATHFLGTTDSQPLRLQAGGVGINTASPDRPLAIQGAGASGEWLSLKGTNGGNAWHLNNYLGGLNFAQSFVADARLFLANNGRVGLGTTGPSARMEIVDGGQMLLQLSGSNDGGSWLNLANAAAGGRSWGFISTGPGNGEGAGKLLLRDHGASTVRMTWDTTGNLGIGTVFPSAPLDVVGTVAADGLRLRSTPALGSVLTAKDSAGQAGWEGLLRVFPATSGSGALAYHSANIIGGGSANIVSNGILGATISGGGYHHSLFPLPNVVGGNYATVVGGLDNRALGDYGFAAGRGAHSQHAGSFVWGDSQTTLFKSTTNNQFLVRAEHGLGINTTNTPDAALTINGHTHVEDHDIFFRGGTDRNHGVGWYQAFAGTNIDGPVLYGNSGGALGTTAGGSKWALTWNTTGEVRVKVLTVVGGADVAEPFEMPKGISKGALVVIDEDRPGELKLADRAYDTRVAGVVSGANGVQPGLSLRQEGALDQGQPVALSGRAYALADASHGAIRPGDLLTTSDTPGHAMRVSDHARAPGAVIGKAMTPLKEGKGMVLVLVNLQ